MTAVPPVDSGHLDAEIVERHGVAQRGLRGRRGLARADQDGIDATGHAEVALQPPERREHRAHFALLGLQGELTHLRRRQRAGRGQPDGPADVLLMSEQRLQGNVGGLLQAGQQHVAGADAKLRGERRRDEYAVTRFDPVKLPEAIVDAVDQHAGGAPARRLVGHDAARCDQGRRRRCAARDEILRQRVPEESHRRDDVAGPPEPRQHEIAKAAAHRVANQQCTAEHGHRRRHAQDDGEVRSPVIGGATKSQAE